MNELIFKNINGKEVATKFFANDYGVSIIKKKNGYGVCIVKVIYCDGYYPVFNTGILDGELKTTSLGDIYELMKKVKKLKSTYSDHSDMPKWYYDRTNFVMDSIASHKLLDIQKSLGGVTRT